MERNTSQVDIHEANDNEIETCYPLMRQLRPHIASADELSERWRRQQDEGYRVFTLWSDGAPRGLAGFRVTENLIYGRFLYVDDLVVDHPDRDRGYGALLMDRLKQEARLRGCAKLVLDTGLDNALAHRFYYRQELLAKALRFHMSLE